MGRKSKQELIKEEAERERMRRAARFVALADRLTDRVEEALLEASTDSKELKQIASILKELMGILDVCSPEERRERELRLLKMAREAEERDDKCEVTVRFLDDVGQYTA